jgi:hypothetical protein
MKLLLVKQLDNSFKCAFDSDLDNLKKIKPNVTVQCTITRPRNVMFHRKYFALLNLVYQNQEKYNNIEHLRKDLTIASGFYTQRENFKGEIITEANSISFASMSNDDFSNYYSKCLDSIIKYFNFDKQDIIDNVEQYF